MNYLATTDFDRFFDNVFANFGNSKSRIPSVDVWEDQSAFHIDAELPGYRMSDVDVHVDKHVLHISSEKTDDSSDRKYLFRERFSATFDRAFTLPENVNEEAIEATFKDGILAITLPKLPDEQPKKINVKIN